MFAIAGILSAASCTQEEQPKIQNEDEHVSARFILESPDGLPTRAIGDGTQANMVKCVIYDASGNKMDMDRTIPITGKEATYQVKLVKGQGYRAVFFAYNDAAGAYDVTDLTNIIVKGSQKANLEGRDAFTAAVDISASESTGPIEMQVPLKRPFAQLNIGAYKDDLTAAAKSGITVANSMVTVGSAYPAFNAYSGAVAGTPAEVTFTMNAIPTEDLLVDVSGDGTVSADEHFAYLSLNYILAGDAGTEKTMTDITFTWENADGSKTNSTLFKNIPLQSNYRTNILGNTITDPVQFDILVDSRFEAAGYIEGIPVPVKENNGVYEIGSDSQLAWIAQQVNTGNTFAGKTVRLTEDIDLSNYPTWTPIGSVSSYPSNTFAGIFDGNGKTISNLTAADITPENAAAGLFGSITGEVMNLTVTKATITSTHYAAVIAAYTSNAAKITGCHVTESTVTTAAELMPDGTYDNGDKAGAIAGLFNNPGAVIDGCTVQGVTIKGYRDLGGIAGYSAGTVQNCQILDNVTITVDNSHPYKGYTTPAQYDANSIVGENHGTMTNNTGDATLNIPDLL